MRINYDKLEYTKQGNYTYLVYELDEAERMDDYSRNILTHNAGSIPGIARTQYSQEDRTQCVKFNVSAKVPASDLFQYDVKRKLLLGVLKGITDAMISAEEEYRLDPASVILNLDYIFVNTQTCETELICLPLQDLEQTVDMYSFVKELVVDADPDGSEDTNYYNKLKKYLKQNTNFAPPEFREFLTELEGQSDSVKAVQEQKPVVVKQEIQEKAVVKQEIPEKIHANQEVQSKPPVDPVSPKKPLIPEKNDKFSNLGDHFGKDANQNKQEEKKSWFDLFGGKKPPKEKKPEPKKPEKPAKPAKPPMGGSAKFQIPGQIPNQIPGQVLDVPAAKEAKNNPEPQVKEHELVQQVINVPLTADVSNAIGATMDMSGLDTGHTKAKLIRVSTNEEIPVNKFPFLIGRENVDYCVGEVNLKVSRQHAAIELLGGYYYLVDRNSKWGTTLNGGEIQAGEKIRLNHGNEFSLADEAFVFYEY